MYKFKIHDLSTREESHGWGVDGVAFIVNQAGTASGCMLILLEAAIVVLGFGVSITTTACPAYVVEMSPPQWRGRLTGLYNSEHIV